MSTLTGADQEAGLFICHSTDNRVKLKKIK